MNEKRLVDIESKFAFQENTIKTLNDVVCRQQEEIVQLQKNYKQLFEQMKELMSLSSDNDFKHEKPPHY